SRDAVQYTSSSWRPSRTARSNCRKRRASPTSGRGPREESPPARGFRGVVPPSPRSPVSVRYAGATAAAYGGARARAQTRSARGQQQRQQLALAQTEERERVVGVAVEEAVPLGGELQRSAQGVAQEVEVAVDRAPVHLQLGRHGARVGVSAGADHPVHGCQAA